MPDPNPAVIVAGHICLDIFPGFLPDTTDLKKIIQPGQLIEIDKVTMSTGGPVANTGLALHKLGIPTGLAGKIGNDTFGQAILNIISSYNQALTSSMKVVESENTSYTIVLSIPGHDRIFLHYTGANDTFTADDVDFSTLQPGQIFHFGYPPLMKKIYEEKGTELDKIIRRAKKAGCITSLDMAKPDPDSPAAQVDWTSILTRIMQFTDIFMPSAEELLFMIDRELYDTLAEKGDINAQLNSDILDKLADFLLNAGCAIVVLKLGSYGLFMKTNRYIEPYKNMKIIDPSMYSQWQNITYYAPCYKVDVAGTTGSGDATIAGFLAGLVKRESPDLVFKSALGVGASNVEKPDAISGIPEWHAVKNRFFENHPQSENTIELLKYEWHAINDIKMVE